MTKKLNNLLSALGDLQIFGPVNLSVSGIKTDSRKVKRGNVFVAIKGLNFNGHDFIPQALSRGASVVVGEEDNRKGLAKGVTYVRVKNSRRALGLLASAWYGNPSEKMQVIGVTGTDGKTTTASLIYWILRFARKKVGLISTIGAKIGTREIDTGLHVTNPDSLALQALLARMVKTKCEYAVLEVTSHGLDQERVAGVDFEVGVLTNITHEHLDYHKNFLNYLGAKAKLFRNVNIAVLNRDDSWYDDVRCVVPPSSTLLSYALSEGEADVLAKNIEQTNSSFQFDVNFWGGSFHLRTNLLGEYNVANTLAALTTALRFGIPITTVQKAVASFKAPPGRLEEIKGAKGFRVFIDFAHTPNSLRNVLTFLKRNTKGKMIAIFGCAGERDREKRGVMGAISGKLADISVFTAEDPRGEDVNEIIREMAVGARKAGLKGFLPTHYHDLNDSSMHYFLTIPERGEAISYAVQKLAKKGDTVVICGKGHERSMAYGQIECPWSDREAAEIAIRGGVKRIKR